MAKIAVYSGNSYCMEVIRGYINNAETKFGMKNQTAYFESVICLSGTWRHRGCSIWS